eukprot:TRINITY_DN779782_c0_g1_i1.p1 TRINITY_DN779782_c0_g1~~TRINITY_DN779782_c0_g1_i1.p1  ORF type:complete len:445 (+),score=118.51 TRINITY_DN779782_c0_g1_i1:113-1447(+)
MLTILWTSVKSVLRVLLSCLVGGFLVKKFFQQKKTSLKDMSQLLGKLLLPSLMIARLGENLTWDELQDSYIVPVFALVYMIIGLMLGRIVSIFCEEQDKPVAMTTIGFSNSVGIPLPIVIALSSDLDWMDEDMASTYIFMLVGVMASGIWSIGWMIYSNAVAKQEEAERAERRAAIKLQSAAESSLQITDGGEEVKSMNTDISSNGSIEVPALGNNDKGATEDEISIDMPSTPASPTDGDSCVMSPTVLAAIGTNDIPQNDEVKLSAIHRLGIFLWNKILTPPLIGTAIGCVIGLVSFLHTFFNDDDQAGFIVFQVIQLFGKACVPVVLVILGSNFLEKPDNTQGAISKGVIALICLARLIIMPIIGVTLVTVGHDLGIVPDNPVMRFVLLSQSATPSPMSMIAVAQLTGGNTRSMSAVLYYMYICAIATITIWNAIFVSMVEP